jgi:putative oxidoreductase
MNKLFQFLFRPTKGPASLFLIRLPVGLIFLTQGVLKFIDPNMGVVRFARIGFPHPYLTAHFVGCFEIVCGSLVLLGLWTRAASVPLIVVISTAIATTKLPELLHPNQGLWYMVSDARTDFAVFCCLLFLILHGGGAWALDAEAEPERNTGLEARGISEPQAELMHSFTRRDFLQCRDARGLPRG